MADVKETSIEFYADEKYFTWYSSETKYINRIKKYAEDYPDEVKIIKEDNFGILAHVSKAWFRAPLPKRKTERTPEQKAAMAERLKKMRESKKLSGN